MNQLPSIEVLESRHQFPGPFLFKVIGHAEGNFVARTVVTVRETLNLSEDPPCSLRQSAHGRHVSVSLEPDCENAQQVLDVYQAILRLDGLVMLL